MCVSDCSEIYISNKKERILHDFNNDCKNLFLNQNEILTVPYKVSYWLSVPRCLESY